jgi:voltage-gated potassium channel
LIRTVREPELRGLALFVLTLFGAGPVFYTVVEDWSVLDSLYFSVMTLLTVGYGDLVPTTDASKVFTMLYVIVGAGALVAFVTVVARQAAGLSASAAEGPGLEELARAASEPPGGEFAASDALGSPWGTKRVTRAGPGDCGRWRSGSTESSRERSSSASVSIPRRSSTGPQTGVFIPCVAACTRSDDRR